MHTPTPTQLADLQADIRDGFVWTADTGAGYETIHSFHPETVIIRGPGRINHHIPYDQIRGIG